MAKDKVFATDRITVTDSPPQTNDFGEKEGEGL